MAAATESRQSASLNSFPEAKYAPVIYDMKTGVTIFAGTMIGLFDGGGDSGKVAPAADVADMIVLGVWNGPDIVEANGDKANANKISRDIQLMVNDTGTPVTAVDMNVQLFVVDDQTVSTATGGNSVKAGFSRGLGEDLAGDGGVFADFSALQ